MAQLGMDPDEVETLARQLSSQAETLSGIITRLDGLVSSMHTNWQGTDSDRFHDMYSSQYRTQINAAVQNLNTLSSTALNQAGEQRRTSA